MGKEELQKIPWLPEKVAKMEICFKWNLRWTSWYLHPNDEKKEAIIPMNKLILKSSLEKEFARRENIKVSEMTDHNCSRWKQKMGSETQVKATVSCSARKNVLFLYWLELKWSSQWMPADLPSAKWAQLTEKTGKTRIYHGLQCVVYSCFCQKRNMYIDCFFHVKQKKYWHSQWKYICQLDRTFFTFPNCVARN